MVAIYWNSNEEITVWFTCLEHNFTTHQILIDFLAKLVPSKFDQDACKQCKIDSFWQHFLCMQSHTSSKFVNYKSSKSKSANELEGGTFTPYIVISTKHVLKQIVTLSTRFDWNPKRALWMIANQKCQWQEITS